MSIYMIVILYVMSWKCVNVTLHDWIKQRTRNQHARYGKTILIVAKIDVMDLLGGARPVTGHGQVAGHGPGPDYVPDLSERPGSVLS